MRIASKFLCLIFAIGSAQAQNAPSVQAVAVEGTLLKVTLGDGRVLRSPDLIGTDLILGEGDQQIHVRIDAVERDPDDERTGVKAEDAVWLHSLSVEEENGVWGPLCERGPDGREQAIPIAGRFLEKEGRFSVGTPSSYELACTSGAMGKCIRFGFHPWLTPADKASAPSKLNRYNTCIRAIRADYGGDGASATKNGTLIDLYNEPGVTSSGADSHMSFEAGWTESGAVCVHHPRVRENVTLADVEARWPRLAGKTGATCTEDVARSLGAVFFNRSVP